MSAVADAHVGPVVRRHQLASATACCKRVNRVDRPAVGAAAPAVLRAGRLPVGRADRGRTGRRSAPSSTRCSRTATRCPNFQDISTDQYQPHRRRPVEDLLLLRLRVPQRRQLRALPRDHAPDRGDPRHGDGDVLDPRARASASRPTTARTRACCGTTSGWSVPDAPVEQRRHPGRRRDRGAGPRARAWSSTTPTSTRRGTTPTRRASCCSSTSCARCGSRCASVNAAMIKRDRVVAVHPGRQAPPPRVGAPVLGGRALSAMSGD